MKYYLALWIILALFLVGCNKAGNNSSSTTLLTTTTTTLKFDIIKADKYKNPFFFNAASLEEKDRVKNKYPKGKFVVIFLEIYNRFDEDVVLEPLRMTLRSGEHDFERYKGDSLLFRNPIQYKKTLKPGEKEDGYIMFDVPKEAGPGYVLIIETQDGKVERLRIP